ncbi:MAG: rod shape-determining protein RodA, partial [Zetaproteobacteria bacterium]
MRRWGLDGPIVIVVLLIGALGLATLYSAVHTGDSGPFVRQVLFWGLGWVAMLIAANLPLRVWAYLAWPAYGAALVLLALVLWFGAVHMGARRWLELGPVALQPSELMKWALVLALAHWYALREPRDWTAIGVGAAMIAAPCLLIAIQPDLGTALIVAMLGVAMLVAAGLRWRWIVGMAMLAVVAAPLVWRFALHDYQRERVLVFLNPERDPLGAGYHLIQSKIAIGSGGLFGKGWLAGTQAHLHFLPEQHTDFIFAVLAEEGGFVAALLLVALYATLL